LLIAEFYFFGRACSRYIASGSNFHILWNQDPLFNKNESYFMIFENLDMRDYSCHIYTTNNTGRVASFDRASGSQLSGLVPLNVTLQGLEVSESDKGMILMDYRFVKFAYNLGYETSVYLLPETNRSKIDYCLVSLEFPNITCETIPSNLSMETTIKFYHERLTDMQYEVCLEILNNVWTVTFKVGLFNSSNFQVFRKKALFELNDPSTYYQTLKDVQLLPLGSYDWGQSCQFLLYQKNTELLYLISSIGGLQKNNNLIAETIKLGFKINMAYFINGQFIILDTKISVRDANGTLVGSFMNYYVLHDLGKKLEVETLSSYKNLSKGRYLNSFKTIDRAIIMMDFQMPDLDGLIDETLISSLYFSSAENEFSTLVEEFTVNAHGVLFLDESYRRYHTQKHLIELHKQVINNRPSDFYFISVKNRETGKDLGTTSIPIKEEIKAVNFLEDEKMLMIKFARSATSKADTPNTLFIAIQDPYLIYKMQVDKMEKPKAPDLPKRRLQVLNDEQDTVLTVKCRRLLEDPNQEFTRATFNFKLLSEFDDYFQALQRNPKNESEKVSKAFEKLTSEYNIAGLLPSGIELNIESTRFIRGSFVDISVTNEKGKKPTSFQLRKEDYWVDLDTLNLSQPIYFERKNGKMTHSTLIMDYHTNTSFYIPSGNRFSFVKKGADSRSLSSIEMLDESNAIINISKNIFSFNFEKLTEQPLIGIGCFCIGAKNVRFNNIDQFLLCMTNRSVSAQYSHEKFAASQTKIRIFQEDFDEFTKNSTILDMLYTNNFPSVVFVLSLPVQKTNERNFSLHAFEFVPNLEIKMQKAVSFSLTELSLILFKEKDQLVYSTVIQNHFIFVTKQNKIFLYVVELGFEARRKYRFTYLRSFDLMDHFPSQDIEGTKSSFELNILRHEHIVMYDFANSKTDRVQVERLCFLIEIVTTRGDSKKMFYNVVIFDHLLSSYEAFDTLYTTTECSKLYMGPAFLNEGDSQERTLSLICLDKSTLEKATTSGKPGIVKLNILQSFKNVVTFSEDISIEDILDLESKEKTESTVRQRSFSLQMTKSALMTEFSRLKPEDGKFKFLLPKMPVKVSFSETFETLLVKTVIAAKFKSFSANQSSASLWFLRKKLFAEYTLPVQEYFDGHIFNTSNLCESQIECRDKIINGTGQLLFEGDVGFMPEYQNSSVFRFGHSSISGGASFNYLVTESEAIFNMSDSGTQVIDLGSLVKQCSEQGQFERFLICFCSRNNTQNFFRILELENSMNYFDINVSLPLNRILNPKEVSVSIKENYLVLYTFNSFIKKYLTAYMFRQTLGNPFETRDRTIFFHNPLFDKLGILYFGENPMNDESVSFKIYRRNDSVLKNPVSLEQLENSEDRLYIWSLCRKNATSFDVRIQGFLVVPKEDPASKQRWLSVLQVCKEKSIELNFDLWGQTSTSYLLDNAKMILMNVEDKDYYDMIFHLPVAQDYLLRISSAKLETSDKKQLNIVEDARVLVISNPFFGIRSAKQMRPIFVNRTYYIPTATFKTNL